MGQLYVVATPIGNLEDITFRATRVILEAGVVVCEDTRRTGQLVKLLGQRWADKLEIKTVEPKKYVSVRDFNEANQVSEVLGILDISDVVLVSDAGTPLLSDPGFKVVRAARAAGHTVVGIPGAFAGAVMASVCGLPTNIIKFWGFLPKKWVLEPGMTHIIYESPIRAAKTCQTIEERYSGAVIMVGQELTKIHEEVSEWRGQKMQGEVTLAVYLGRGKVGEEVAAAHGNGGGDLEQTEDGGGDVA